MRLKRQLDHAHRYFTSGTPLLRLGGRLGRFAIASALLSVFALINPVAAETRVVIGTPGRVSDNSLAVSVAIDKGYYKDAGLDVELVDFKGGAPSIQALVGGGVQYVIAAPEHVVRLRQRGVDGVASFALQNTHTYVLLAKDSSPVKSFADLKGKRVGITSAGSLTENLIRLQAKRSGLDYDSDIEVVGAGVGAAQKAAIDSDRIDAGMFGNIDALQLVGSGYHVVFDWREQRIPGLGLLTLASWQDEHPEVAKGIVQATLKAQKLILSDRETSIDGLKQLYPDLDPLIIEKVADSLQTSLSTDGRFSQSEFDDLQKDLVEIEPNLPKVDYAVAFPGQFLN